MAEILEHKVALITGGANGIGAGGAIIMAGQGAKIAICDKDVEAGEALADKINAAGGEAIFIKADYLEPETCAAAVQSAHAHFGALDIIVNNVGGVGRRMLTDQRASNIERVLNLNLMSMVLTTQAGAPLLRQNGAVINIASTEALRAAPGFSIYSASKAAMTQFTKTMALELADKAIRVNCIAPDHIATPGLSGLMDMDVEQRDKNVPLGRMASIEEVGEVIAFLAGPKSSWINGTTIPVDGGITAAAGWHRGQDGEWTL